MTGGLHFQSPTLLPLVAALTRTVQELQTRVETLEGARDASHPYHRKLKRVLDRMGGLNTLHDILEAIAAGRMQSFMEGDSWAITRVWIIRAGDRWRSSPSSAASMTSAPCTTGC